jgi:hypothetical protein
MTMDLTALDRLVLEPRAIAVDRNDHFVELYEDDTAMVDSVRTFLSIGINNGEAGVLIATSEHTRAIEAELVRTVDVEAARRTGLLTSLDAAETLSLFMEGGEIDADRFANSIGRVLDAASAGGRRVRVFGEMVALLWADGNVSSALSLEDHWNELARSYPFRLFCAYPSTAFDAGDTSSLTGVCNRHSHVVVPRR